MTARSLLLPLPGAVVLLLLAPRPASALEILESVCVPQSDNALRFDCNIKTDDHSDVKIEFCNRTDLGTDCTKNQTSETVETGVWKWGASCPTMAGCWHHELTVWNMVADKTYEWQAVADDGTSIVIDEVDPVFGLDTGPLPAELAAIDIDITLSGTSELEQLMLNYGCQTTTGGGEVDLAFAINPEGDIVWYQDPRLQTGLSNSNIRALTVPSTFDSVLVIDDDRALLEYDLSGDVLAHLDEDDFLIEGVQHYVHHDVMRKGDDTYVVMARDQEFDVGTVIVDGVFQYDSSWNLVEDTLDDLWYLTDIYPDEDFETCTGSGGAYWADKLVGCDYSHMNSMWVDTSGNWLFSFHNLDRLAKVNGLTGALLWELHGDNDTTGLGDWDSITSGSIEPTFSHQHNAHWTYDGKLRLFDNHTVGGATGEIDSRGVEIELVGVPGSGTFEIVDEWDTELSCGATGSTFGWLPSGNVVVTCGPMAKDTIIEFDSSGEVWKAKLSCDTGSHLGALYRAQPMSLED